MQLWLYKGLLQFSSPFPLRTVQHLDVFLMHMCREVNCISTLDLLLCLSVTATLIQMKSSVEVGISGLLRMRTLIPCFPISRFTTFMKSSAHVGLTTIIIIFFNHRAIHNCNNLFHPLGPCILQEKVWSNAYLVRLSYQARNRGPRGLLSDSFIFEKCAWFSLSPANHSFPLT